MAKPKKPASRLKASEVLREAKELADPEAQAARLERGLDEVKRPAKLVVPLIRALRKSLSFDKAGERVVELCTAHKHDVAFLEAAGDELDEWYHDEKAELVLQMARTAGARGSPAMVTLARLMCNRGDASGLPLLEEAIAANADYVFPRVTLASWYMDKDPARALGIIAVLPDDHDDEYAHDLRSMLLSKMQRKNEARRAERRAIECCDHPLIAHDNLCQWHFYEDRYDRALVHARILLERRIKKPNEFKKQGLALDEIDSTIMQAFRLGGAFGEILDWVRERCAEKIPSRGAYHIYNGLVGLSPNPDPELARRVARQEHADYLKCDDPGEARLWLVREALVSANEGDFSGLEGLARAGLEDDPEAWCELAGSYLSVGQIDAASAAVDRALTIDPSSAEALAALFDLALAAGDAESLHKVSVELSMAKPTWHQGPEHLARSFARRGDAEAALTASERALRMGAFCTYAWLARAEALAIAGDRASAKTALARSVSIEAAEPGDDKTILAAALAGDPAALDRALAARYPNRELPFPIFVERLRGVARG